MIDWDSLIESAKEARKNAYAIYSDFRVGAALLTTDGEIFTGCNVENGSYGLTICAERTAVFKAVSEGKKEFKAILVFTDSTPPARPCGACLQVLAEFDSDIDVACVNTKGKQDNFKLTELFPEGFSLKK